MGTHADSACMCLCVRTHSDTPAHTLCSTVTPTDVAKRLIAAVAKSNTGADALHAIIALNEADLLAQAAASAARHKTGQLLSPYDGVPITIKDEIDVRGYRTSAGTSFLGGDAVKEQDAVAVMRLRAKGFLIAGKSNMMEIGIQPFGYNR